MVCVWLAGAARPGGEVEEAAGREGEGADGGARGRCGVAEQAEGTAQRVERREASSETTRRDGGSETS